MSPAKVIPPKGKPFFVEKDEEISHTSGFSRLSRNLREDLGWLGIFGMGYGFHITSMDGSQGGACIDVFKSKIVFRGSSEDGWGMRFERNPVAVVFLQDGTRIEPVTNKEMKAELDAKKKPSRRER